MSDITGSASAATGNAQARAKLPRASKTISENLDSLGIVVYAGMNCLPFQLASLVVIAPAENRRSAPVVAPQTPIEIVTLYTWRHK
jgi:hypothetical protein